MHILLECELLIVDTLNARSRLYQIAKLYLYSPSAGLYTCPLAMTDGAARSLEVSSNETITRFTLYFACLLK